MKMFLAKKHRFSELTIYKAGNTIITSGISTSIQVSSFENDHVNCASCERFCALLKEKFQQHFCDTKDAELEFRICLNATTMRFSIEIHCDILGVLPALCGLLEQAWVKVKLDDTPDNSSMFPTGILGSMASQKILIEKGKIFYEGQMSCSPDWIDFFMSSSSEDTLDGTFSVMFGVDNMIHCDAPIQVPENKSLVALNASILEKQIATDLVLTSENGTQFPCHRNFLSAHSATFEAMLKDKNFVEAETGEIVVNDMTEGGVKAFLKFLYCRDTKEPSNCPSIAIELLTCGNKYGIDILVHSLREILLSKPTDWFDLSTAMRLFYYGCQVESQREFKQKALQVLRMKSLTEIENSTDYKQLFSENPEAAKELCTALLSHLTLNK